MAYSFPRIYPILDSTVIDAAAIPGARRAEFLRRLATELAQTGITLLEYRNKTADESQLLADAAILREHLLAPNIKLILDDRADLIEQIGFDGVHVDAGDMIPAAARRLLGPSKIVGTFGGSESLLPGILAEPVDYLSIGPIFLSQTKQSTRAPIRSAGVRKLRDEAGPNPVLVAAGGITLESAPAVFAAGATTVAVSAAIFRAADPAAELRRWLTELK